MALRVEQVTEENVHLHSEFRKMLEGQINAATQGAGVGGVVDSLQEDLKLVSKERDSFQSMLNKTLQELQILQKSEQVCFEEHKAQVRNKYLVLLLYRIRI